MVLDKRDGVDHTTGAQLFTIELITNNKLPLYCDIHSIN